MPSTSLLGCWILFHKSRVSYKLISYKRSTSIQCILNLAASSGDYVPVLVDHSDELPCRGQYYLHHGLQRRIRITLVHTSTSDLKWKDVREVVVGRIRVTPDCDPEDDLDASVLSLGLFPGEYLDRQVAGEDRTMFRFEAAWDSSLHNSLLLNRVTPAGGDTQEFCPIFFLK